MKNNNGFGGNQGKEIRGNGGPEAECKVKTARISFTVAFCFRHLPSQSKNNGATGRKSGKGQQGEKNWEKGNREK